MFNPSAYLFARYNASKKQQRRNGRTFCLTFPEYMELITPKGEARVALEYNKYLAKRKKGKIKGPFKTSHVLTWKSNQFMLDGICSKDTMHWATINESKRIGMIKGQKHTEESKRKIALAASKPRKPWTADRKESVSIALLGTKQSPETVAKRKATWAAKKLAKAKSVPVVEPEVIIPPSVIENHMEIFETLFLNKSESELNQDPYFISWSKKAARLGIFASDNIIVQ